MEPIAKRLAGFLALEVAILVILNTGLCLSSVESSGKLVAYESCHLREFELSTVGLLAIFQNPNGLPTKAADVKRQCGFLNESIDGLEDYARNCLTKNQEDLMNMFIKDSIKLARDFCHPDSELRKNYSKHVGCYREIQRKFQKTCLTDFQVGFEGIHKMNMSEWMTTGCCNLNRFRECVFVPLENECGAEATEFVEEVLRKVTGTWWELPCRAYTSGNSDCERLLPEIGTKPYNGRNTSAISRLLSGFTTVLVRP